MGRYSTQCKVIHNPTPRKNVVLEHFSGRGSNDRLKLAIFTFYLSFISNVAQNIEDRNHLLANAKPTTTSKLLG